MLTKNVFVRLPLGLYYFWFSSQLPDYFPLTWSSLWLEWRVWGMNATGYHITNIILHASSALLLWRCLKRLDVPGAWFAALLFGIHPVNVQSVAWIAERKNTLSMLFYLLSVYFFIRSGDASEPGNMQTRSQHQRFYWLSFIAFVLAMLSKSAVVMFPVVLLGIIWWRTGSITWQRARQTIPYFATSLALGMVTIWFQTHRAIGQDIVRTDDFLTRLAVAGRAVWFYAQKTVVPFNLCFVYPGWENDSHRVLTYLPLVAIIAVLALLWNFRKRIGRAPFFAFMYFLLMLLPILGFLNIYYMRYALVSDHWAYFADAGLIALITGVGGWMFHQVTGAIKWLLPAAALGISISFAVTAFRQANIYHDAETLWQDTLQKNPGSWLAHNGIGSALAARGDFHAAREHYVQAANIKPDSAEVQVNCGSVLLELRRPDEAMPYIRRALDIDPKLATGYYNLGNAFDQLNNPAEAERSYRKSIELDPDYAEAHSNLGVLLYNNGKKKEALEAFTRAVSLRPDYIDGINNLGTLFLEMGQAREALTQLRHATQLDPNNADANFNLGNALLTLGFPDEAAENYRRAIAVRPQMGPAHCRLGIALWKDGKGDAKASIQELNQALQLNTADAEAYYYAGIIMYANKEVPNAIRLLRRAVELRPQWPEAMAGLAFPLATATRAIDRDPEEALDLASRAATITSKTNFVVLDALAAAYAANEKFEDASATALKAAELADAAGAKDKAERIRMRRTVFTAGKVYRE